MKFWYVIIIILAALCFIIWQNNSIVVTESDYVNAKIPEAFHNFKIAHISDLHNKRFGKGQTKILKKLKNISPDIIVITGDMIDRRKYDLDAALEFIEGAISIAPVYYVSGNHEAWSGKYESIKESLEKAGVTVLDDIRVELKRGDSTIYISGLSDPDFLTSSYLEGTETTSVEEQLRQWSAYNDDFNILLSHRPELFDMYCKYGMDLIFTGHAHGGQFRIPFIGGLVAPDQGFFPKYTSGSHTKNLSTMYVSRGLGNSIVPIRIFNRPEIVVVSLESRQQSGR
ncbi:MAG TPA: metallophosphoesterase [Clostridiales bacterium]|nr:metallophosphoesterase [Clostridiales bacterium]